MGPGERALEPRMDPRGVLGTRELEPVQLVPQLMPPVQNNHHHRNLEKIQTTTKTKTKTHVIKPPGSPMTLAWIPALCSAPRKEGGRA